MESNEDNMQDAELVFDEELLTDSTSDDTASSNSDQRARPDTLRAGDLIAGKYCIERVHRRSALGVTAEATHVQLGQRVAIKLLLADPRAYPEAVGRFLRGARAAAQMQNEHVTRVLDVGTLDSGAPYVVSEYLAGSDLRRVLAVREALTVPEAVDAALQVAEALAEGHALGFPHRNLKPSNIFLVRRSEGPPLLKVLDFFVSDDPLSDVAINLSGTSSAAKSLAYLAPEQIREPHAVDARADIWALGAVLHEALTGSPVFEASTTPGLLAMIAADEPAPMSTLRHDIPAQLESIVLRCLAKDREDRPRTMAELALELKSFASLDGHESVERITRTLSRKGRSTRPPPLPGPGARAIVHVGPAPLPPAPAVQPAGAGRRVAELAAVAAGFAAAAAAGAFFAVRTMQGALLQSGVAQRGLVASFDPAQAAPISSERAAPAADPSAVRAVPPPAAAPAAAPAGNLARAAVAALRPAPAAPRAAAKETPAHDVSDTAKVADAKPAAHAERAKDFFDDAN